MTGDARRRAGRPADPVLTPELIAQAGLRLLDESATGDFTMVELATSLGVRASAIYNHVAGKDEVLARVRELVSDRIDVSAFERMPWDEAVAVWARSYRIAFATHPRTIALFAITPVAGARRTVGMYEAVTRAFREAGWPPDRILTAVVALENFILGAALDLVAPGDILDPAGDEAAPALAEAYARQREALGGEPPADAAFELGLAALIAGLRAWRDA
ncbi:TetR/AcrR family transcriptional regulator C-terminal domain-containing protein [Gryllotalpicola koreensis]|uniref:HTH tetR-type domain-containing protein n=1 Tax=Gryllotalpicola koreensis TaxID=993086 RepID=A0ABP7ZTQ4_9MICO